MPPGKAESILRIITPASGRSGVEMENSKRLGDRLVEAGLITREHLLEALEIQKGHGGRLGDVLLENGLVAEQALLRFLAAEYKTRYVSVEKLSKVKIPSAILDRVPVQMAEKASVLPILWNEQAGILSVVMAEPQNIELIEEIRLIAEANEVAAYIGSRSAVLAGVRKHYYGDISAFADFSSQNYRTRQDVRNLAEYYEHARTGISELSVPMETNPRARETSSTTRAGRTNIGQTIEEVHGASLTSDNDFIETLNVLVGLLELPRGSYKGHSAAVAKLTRTLSKRMGLSAREVNHNIIAAYLHDLGKKATRHITLPKMADEPKYVEAAKRYYRTPSRLFEAVHLPVEVNSILARLYEAWDGTGVPGGIRGNEIPLGSRIIAAIDAFEDLTRAPIQGVGKPLNQDLALATLTSYAGTMLDPQIVELLRQVLTGDLMRQKLLADGQHIVVIEPDAENSSLLELKLTQKGYIVSLARDAQVAMQLIRGGADLVISETSIPGDDGFAMISSIKEQPWGKDVPVIFLTSDSDSDSVERGLALGAIDYVVKPYAVEVFLAKVRRHMDASRSKGSKERIIRGNLEEMPPVDILRVLSEAGRSGQIQIKGRRKAGEIFLENGRISHATFGRVTGEEALGVLLGIRTGDFAYNSSVNTSESTISGDLEQLIERRRQRQAGG